MGMRVREKRAVGMAVASALLGVGLLLGGVAAQAADDPSIQGQVRARINQAMIDFVVDQSVDGVVRLYDPVDGKLLHLRFAGLHQGVVKKGDFYVSCADFVDQDGRKIDVDFLVIPVGEELRATQGIVHSVDGSKRKYHLE